ncbi:MAG: hypothetical protein MUD14_10090 [Hydrococcus sp. Prado102]|jgi:hypothetical protein|nr:hypothetical protein [Hydrococcus sp. Prado102]
MVASRNWIRQKSFLRDAYNKEVKRWFRDVGDTEIPDFTTGRGAVMAACLIAAGDSQNMAILKMETFRTVVQRTHLRPHVYGIPTHDLQNEVKFQPQIILHFLQDTNRNYDSTKDPITGRISFRVTDETYKTINKAKILSLANAVKREFMTNNGYVWSKGRKMATYQHWEKGYRLQLLYFSETEVKTLIRKVLSIQDDTVQERYLNLSKNSDELTAFPGVPETETILGKVEKLPQRRPVVDVRFTHAELHVWGRHEPIILCDRTYRYRSSLVSAA